MMRIILFMLALVWSGAAFAQAQCAGNKCGQLGPSVPDMQQVNTLAVSGPVYAQNVGITPLATVQAATAAPLTNNPTYNNGAAGLGATLIATSTGALSIDGYSPNFGDRVLVRNQALAYQNGVYIVTAIGSGSAPYQLSRSNDLDQGLQFFNGVSVAVANGNQNAGLSFALITSAPINLGATPLTFTPYTVIGSTSASYVSSLTALKNAATTNYPRGVWRNTYGNGNGAAPLFYNPSNSPCSLNAGAGDNGSQVQSADGKCWIAALGSPPYDVLQFGYIADGLTDNTQVLQNAVNALPIEGGAVMLPAGVGCIFGGLSTIGVTLSSYESIQGLGTRASTLSACGHDTTVLTIGTFQGFVRNLQIFGDNAPTATHTTLNITSSSELVLLDDIYVAYGQVPISSQGGDVQFRNSAVNAAYGGSFFFVNGGNIWVQRSTFDQSLPYNNGVLPSCTPNCTISPWTTSQTFASGTGGTQVTNQGFYLQLMTNTGCTTASSGGGPTLAPYGTNMTDGSCTWQLAGSPTTNAIQLAAGQEEAKISQADVTCSICQIGIYSLAGSSLNIKSTVVTGEHSDMIAIAGTSTYSMLSDDEIGGGQLTNNAGIDVITTGTGINITNSFINSPYFGIRLQSGGVNISNVAINMASTTDIQIESGVNKFNIANSNMITGGATAINIASGASTRYNVVYNLLACSGGIGNTCVNNAPAAGNITGNQ